MGAEPPEARRDVLEEEMATLGLIPAEAGDGVPLEGGNGGGGLSVFILTLRQLTTVTTVAVDCALCVARKIFIGPISSYFTTLDRACSAYMCMFWILHLCFITKLA